LLEDSLFHEGISHGVELDQIDIPREQPTKRRHKTEIRILVFIRYEQQRCSYRSYFLRMVGKRFFSTSARSRYNRLPRMKNEDTLDRLIDVGADSLARALLHLAQRHEDAAAAVERLVSKPEARLTSFRQLVREITRLTERGGYIDWRETRAFANELEDALLALRDASPDPKLGVELTVDFLEKGQELIESCDDSDGLVADVYRYDSIELFVQYARDCSDAQWLADLTVRLIRDDEYGLNERLIDRAFEYLPATLIYRALLDDLLRRGYSRAYDHGVRYLRSLDRLAAGISDWRDHQTHDTYFAGLKAKHGRKYSFWNRYDDILRPE